MILRGTFVLLIAIMPFTAAAQEPLQPITARGDSIDQPLTGAPGDPARGQALIEDRQHSLCMLCHAGPFSDVRLQGDLGPDLGGVGARLTPGQIRLRIIDMKRVVPSTIMPAYYRADGLQRVAPAWRGKSILTAADIEDLVAYLATLKD